MKNALLGHCGRMSTLTFNYKERKVFPEKSEGIQKKIGRDNLRWHYARRPRGGQSGREKRRDKIKFSRTGGKATGYRLSPDHFQTVKWMLAPYWAQKMLCIIVPNRLTASPEFFSWIRTRLLLSRPSCPVRSPSLCVQGKIAWPFRNGPVRVGTQGLFRPCLKTFVAPFLQVRLTAFGSPRMP